MYISKAHRQQTGGNSLSGQDWCWTCDKDRLYNIVFNMLTPSAAADTFLHVSCITLT